MATTADSTFLASLAPQPNINSGWSVRVLDYKDMKSLVAVISEFSSLSFTQQLNDPGTGSITMDEDSYFWEQTLQNGGSNRKLLDNEYVFEAWENNTPRFSWIAQTVENTIIGTDETRAITISGPGIAQVLSWASIHRPGWPTKVPIDHYTISQADGKTKIPVYRANSYQDTIPAFLWRFPLGWPTMRMWYTVFKAAQRRGLIKWVTPMFTALKDSGGKKWVAVKTLDEVAMKEGYQPDTPSENLLDFLNDCTGQDYSKWFGQRLEWLMHPGFKLDVRPTIGTNKTNSVRFFQGNILSDTRTRDRQPIANRIMAVDVDGNETMRQDAKSVAQWNLREQRNETNKNVTDSKLKASLADRYIQQFRNEKDQWTIAIPYDDPGRMPFRDFNVGDKIGVNADYFGAVPTAIAGPTEYRVMAISISITSDQTVPDCELTLKSLIDFKQDDLQKQITQLINNPVNADLTAVKQTNNIQNANDGDAMVYNAKTGKWEPGSVGGIKVFIGSADPGAQASEGDFWLEIAS